MDTLQTKLNAFKHIVIDNCKNENFPYREWFVDDHLTIVERIAMELCDKHPEADKDAVFALVWFHDFGKSIDEENECETTKNRGVEAMRTVGLPEDFIQRVLKFWIRMEMKTEIDISNEDIEVQIVSTADGASHFVGKFYATYFTDDPKESIQSIVARIKDKISKDWERKIVLPEAKQAFQQRYEKTKEIIGEYPDKFLL
jgi:HD superfamily phosphodiesterase